MYLIFPILLYACEACGSNKLRKCDQIQHRAMHVFHKHAPILGLQVSDMGWTTLIVDGHVSMARLYNRLINIDCDGLTK